MRIHFIAIGGSAMHNLAIALHRKGDEITGSDDEIFEPSKSRLNREGILPDYTGWNPDMITSDLDAVVVGMHARKDNPELAKAKSLNIPIFSYPEYVFEQTRNKKRVVIGGSHGKTTITSMILHVLNELQIEADYLVGAQLEGYDCMVNLSEANDIAIIEGDEYLSSPLDPRPKFHLYKPNVALLTGVAWDHINVFPTFENYVEQFEKFVYLIEPDGALVYYDGDEILRDLASKAPKEIRVLPYNTHPHEIRDGKTYLSSSTGEIEISVFGKHNIQNLNGARLVLNEIGVSDSDFYRAIASFTGASKRLEKVAETSSFSFYKDFAHAPSKLKATTSAIKEQYPDRPLIACMELHTFSSLNKDFLPQYEGAMEKADRAYVYFSPDVVAHKRLTPITVEDVKAAFATENVEVFTDSKNLLERLQKEHWQGKNLLMMSSGNFDGIDFEKLGGEITPS